MKICCLLALLVVILANYECASTRKSLDVKKLHKNEKISAQLRKAIRAYNLNHGTSYKLKHPQRAFFSILTNGDKEYVIDAKTTPGVSMKKGAEQQHGFCEVKMVKKKKSGRFANGHVTKCATY